MSMKFDIDSEFEDLIAKHPELKGDILACKFGVYESLDWDDAASETVTNIMEQGFEIDGNMRCYLNGADK